jgi:hypothetical protein
VIHRRPARFAPICILFGLIACAPTARAQRAPYESLFTPDWGKLPLTAGFADVDGAGGGGLVPWADHYGLRKQRRAEGLTLMTPWFP